MRFAVLFHLPDCKIDSVPFDVPLLRFSPSILAAQNRRRFPTHSTMKREPCRQVYISRRLLSPSCTDNNRSNQRETTREDSKSGRASGARVSTLAAESNFVECHPRGSARTVVQRSASERSNRSIAISS